MNNWQPLEEYESDQPQSHAWMISFADLISLVLTFFILIYSMSLVDLEKWESFSSSFAQKAPKGASAPITTDNTPQSAHNIPLTDSSDVGYLASILENKLAGKNGESPLGTIKLLSDRIILRIQDTTFFKAYTAENSDTHKQSVSQLMELLSSINNQIDIVAVVHFSEDLDITHQAAIELAMLRARNLSISLRNNGFESTMQTFGNAVSVDPSQGNLENQQSAPISGYINILIRTYSRSEAR